MKTKIVYCIEELNKVDWSKLYVCRDVKLGVYLEIFYVVTR